MVEFFELHARGLEVDPLGLLSASLDVPTRSGTVISTNGLHRVPFIYLEVPRGFSTRFSFEKKTLPLNSINKTICSCILYNKGGLRKQPPRAKTNS